MTKINNNIERLYSIAHKKERLIIGLMSGTSFDGLDMALCRITGSGNTTRVTIEAFETAAYDADFKEGLKEIFSRHDADLEKVCIQNAWVARKQASLINNAIKKWGYKQEDIDLVASHGQTIYHAPRLLHGYEQYPNATLQIGDGDHISVLTGIITVSDFRQKHIAAGGEGAPLAVYGDYIIFSKPGENRIMLNIGGIANFTYLPGDMDGTKVFSTDVGPGNTMMDAYMQQHYPGKYFDDNALIARSGAVNEKLLSALKDNSFFASAFPKTIGPELFNISYIEKAQQNSGTSDISKADVMATLNYLSAAVIAEAIKKCFRPDEVYCIYASGGGMHNPLLMETLQSLLPGVSFYTTDSLGINPDAKEAVLFALLANETVAGGPIKLGQGRKNVPAVTMGKISFPD